MIVKEAVKPEHDDVDDKSGDTKSDDAQSITETDNTAKYLIVCRQESPFGILGYEMQLKENLVKAKGSTMALIG